MNASLRFVPLLAACCCAAFAEERGSRPDLVARVKSGELKTARASWWGFDAADSTAPLQAAISSGVPRLVVDRMAGPWIVRPLSGVSNQEILLEDGAEMQAKRGEFHGKLDCLISYHDAENVVLRGKEGAVLRMHHDDYTNRTLYSKSEWRNAIGIWGVRNFTVRDLALIGSGGDGIYVGTSGPGRHCRDVTIRNVVSDGNNRQGISVISVDGLLIEGCTLKNTRGASPESGLDIEPNHNWDVLRNIVVRDCTSVGNNGCGYEVMIYNMDGTSEPIDIRFENCRSSGNRRKYRFTRPTNPVRDFTIRCDFVNCRIEEMGRPPVSFQEGGLKPRDAAGREVKPVDADAAALAKAKVVDTAPGASVRTTGLAFRGENHFWIYADRPGRVTLKGILTRAGGVVEPLKDQKLSAKVVSADGAATLSCEMAQDADGVGTFAFNVPARGFYSFGFHTRGLKWIFRETNVPIAAYRGHGAREPSLNGRPGSVWFSVPKGCPSFACIAAGGGSSECVAARFFAPDGREEWSVDDVSQGDLHVTELNPQSGLWRAEASRATKGCMDDFSLDVVGVPLCFFLTPEKYWEWQ